MAYNLDISFRFSSHVSADMTATAAMCIVIGDLVEIYFYSADPLGYNNPGQSRSSTRQRAIQISQMYRLSCGGQHCDAPRAPINRPDACCVVGRGVDEMGDGGGGSSALTGDALQH